MSLPAPLIRPHGQWTANPEVTLRTSLGSLRIELLPQFAPSTVANWLGYVNADYFNGLIFHRVIDGFMVQGGGFNASMLQQTPLYPALALESNNGLSNRLGSLAMARTDVPDSGTSQFFINDVNNARLDYSGTDKLARGYAVFGQVTSGLDVVQAISAVATTTEKGHDNVPVNDVLILDASETVAGAVRSGTGRIELTLQSGATWSYSLDSGASWSEGTGQLLDLPAGTYAQGQVQVRQSLADTTSAAARLPAITVVDGAPSVRVSAQKLLLGRNQDTQITFTLSQPSEDFTVTDVSVLGGQLVNFQGAGTSYSATLVPTVSQGREVVVQVHPGQFTNAQGTANLDSSADEARLALTADAQPPLAPLLLAPGVWLQNPQARLYLRPSGTATVELLPEAAPLQVANWLAYVQARAYTYTLVQPSTNTNTPVAIMGLYGGPFTNQYQAGLFPSVPQESNNGLSNTLGTLSALHNNTTKATANGFFVNLANNSSLDYTSASSTGYTVFARTLSGADTWSKLATTSNDTLIDLATVEQTVSGTLRLPTAQLSVAGLSTGALWQYSLDRGLTWAQGSGNSLQLPAGVYQAHQVQVQVQGSDAVGNSPALSTLPHQMLVGVQATHWAKGTALSAVVVSQSASGYKVSAPAPADPAQAISLSDVLAALKIYLNKPLGNASLRPYQTVAADLDANGKVDLSDVLNLLKIYLKKPLSTDLSPQWTFVDAHNEYLSTSGKPIDPANAAAAPIDWQQADLAPVQLIGVLRGDVDGSFSG